MSTRIPADVVFKGHTGHYKANAHKTKPGDTQVCFRNQTGSPVLVWFPDNFLVGSPATIAQGDTVCYPIREGLPGGVYTYAAQVTTTGEFVEGGSPPEIVIDR